MPITPDAVKLLESERLTDEPDGGGRATNREIESGLVNNLFPDISRLNRTVGAVHLRKVYSGPQTDDDDVFLGAHSILSLKPRDASVSVVLFDTASYEDLRSDARDRIESYVTRGRPADFGLLGNHLRGQRTLSVAQYTRAVIPEVGETYYLEDPTSGNNQYVRVTSVDYSHQIFTVVWQQEAVDVERRVLTLGLANPLNHDFPGGEVTRIGLGPIEGVPMAESYYTQVVDAARYYGAAYLAEPVAVGALDYQVDNVLQALVPSALKQVPVIDERVASEYLTVVPARDVPLSLSRAFTVVSGTTSRAFLGSPCVPCSLSLTLDGGTYVDGNGNGTLVHVSGNNNFSLIQLDHASGQIDATRTSGTFTGTASSQFMPGGLFSGPVHTSAFEITNQNRGFVYVLNLADSIPRPGTLRVYYLAMGKWLTLADRGDGTLEGDGSGTIQFGTGSTSLTLAYLPDAGTRVYYSWQGSGAYELDTWNGIRTLSARVVDLQIDVPPGKQVAPGSVSISWAADAVAKSATDNGQGGFTGDITAGTIDYSTGQISIEIAKTADADYTVTASLSEAVTEVLTVGGMGTELLCTLGTVPVEPGSVVLRYRVTWGNDSRGNTYHQDVYLIDDGAGGFGEILLIGNGTTGFNAGATINYSTGDISLPQGRRQKHIDTKGYSYPAQNAGQGSFTAWRAWGEDITAMLVGAPAATYAQANPVTEAAPAAALLNVPLTLDLLGPEANPVLPGSLWFTFEGVSYFDRDGGIYTSFSPSTNAGVLVGRIDYDTAVVTLTTYPAGANDDTVTIQSMATMNDQLMTAYVSLRTPGRPVQVASLQITAVSLFGDTLTASADGEGVISSVGGNVHGQIDVNTGVADIYFTTDPNDETGESSIPVYPQSIRFNTVLETRLPLNANLIGLDPVRLPPDGRVPVFQPADVVVLLHWDEVDAGTPAADQVVDVGREFIAEFRVIDSSGLALDPNQYTEDREAGTVTFANPLTLQAADATPLVPPITVRHRIEHMTMLSDVQIGGTLTGIAPSAHDFPAGETIVASAVTYGDKAARAKNWFEQAVWNSGSPNWSDERIGAAPSASYNTIDFPPVMLNSGAITERWALVFTSSTEFNIVGEERGIIGSGTTSTATAPLNPVTGKPYFTVPAEGWGVGWVSGNAVRFNTEAALSPLWVARVILPGVATHPDDDFELLVRGDAD